MYKLRRRRKFAFNKACRKLKMAPGITLKAKMKRRKKRNEKKMKREREKQKETIKQTIKVLGVLLW